MSVSRVASRSMAVRLAVGVARRGDAVGDEGEGVTGDEVESLGLVGTALEKSERVVLGKGEGEGARDPVASA